MKQRYALYVFLYSYHIISQYICYLNCFRLYIEPNNISSRHLVRHVCCQASSQDLGWWVLQEMHYWLSCYLLIFILHRVLVIWKSPNYSTYSNAWYTKTIRFILNDVAHWKSHDLNHHCPQVPTLKVLPEKLEWRLHINLFKHAGSNRVLTISTDVQVLGLQHLSVTERRHVVLKKSRVSIRN